jgi:hypothetical protein
VTGHHTQVSGYTLPEALALLAPLVGIPVEDARDYVLVVITKDGAAAMGASERIPPPLAAEVLRSAADSIAPPDEA